MPSTTVNYPEEFKGFAIYKSEDWANPKLTSYPPKTFGDHDVDIEIETCSVCASELMTLQDHWGKGIKGPQVVGHEVIGKIKAVGSKVTKHKVGDFVGLGAQAFACLDCSKCHSDNEQYCDRRAGVYAGKYADGYMSQGGYASHVRVHEHFVFPLPDEFKSEAHLIGPLMCGGLTVYSPIVRALEGIENPKVAIIGIGGLGHMAILLASALGAEVTAFSRSSAKKEDAFKLGAKHFVATAEDKDWNIRMADSFDLILNCASSTSNLELDKLLPTLKVNRQFISAGLPDVSEKFQVSPFTFLRNGCGMSASKLGSRKEALEMLNLVLKKNIRPWVECIPIGEEGVHEALTRLDKGDVKYRFTLTGFHDFFGTGN